MIGLASSIAFTHVRYRLRQTVVAVAGVAVGVGFSIMMAALMVGSQQDFTRQLIDSMPHITVFDEHRTASRQPAELVYAAAEIRGLRPELRRRGIKNPLATMASLEGWLPGTVAPATKTQGIIKYAGRDVGVAITGIDPQREARVSKLPTQMRVGTLDSLYRATNAIILGDRLAEKIGARLGAKLTVQSSDGGRVSAQVVGLFRSGSRAIDEGTAYMLLKTSQILAGQTSLVNELRLRVGDPMAARDVAGRVERETGYKSVAWQEANEDLLNTFVIRNLIMYTVVGAILLVASFGTFNIISTITHEKTRDIAIMKSLGLDRGTVQLIFVIEALLIGLAGVLAGWLLGYLMTRALGTVEIKSPFMDATHLPLAYAVTHYLLAAAVALTSSLVAGYFPARKASGLQPMDVIRGAT